MVPKEIGDGELNRRNQSIPSKKLLAGQDLGFGIQGTKVPPGGLLSVW